MRGLAKLAWSEFRLTLRDPMTAFWSLAFPALWFLLMVVVIGMPIPGFDYHGQGFASLVFPASISLVILSTSFIGVPIALTTYREAGVLRRLRVTPVKVTTLVAAYSLSQLAFTVVGVAVVTILAMGFFEVRILGSALAFVGVLFCAMVTFLALGSAIGSVARTTRTANIIIWSAFTPMLMLSELFMPLSLLPRWLQPIAKALPLTPVNTLLRDIVFGVALGDLWRFGVLGAWAVVSLVLTVRFFRWE
ncbi:MAG: ABC transporter permease [Candidatus Bipolaricaulota bacterium]|nr:ABC transporter permease [Candidatus Bipolaricaulota bacterium]